MSSRMVTLDSDVFKCCHKVETLGWSNDPEAKSLLQRAADQVKPIMARRKWAVLLLTEFYPPMPNLLGMNHNHGERIEIRLRSPSNPDVFLPHESILGTLLHELAHIEVGPHNSDFYKLLDELNDECDSLIARGVIPDSSSTMSFTGDGTRLSGSRPPPKHIAKERAVAAAQRRNKINQLMPSGGRVLGGDSELAQIGALCDPREMALAAAQRRANDEVWCSSATLTPTQISSASSNDSTAGTSIQQQINTSDNNNVDSSTTQKTKQIPSATPRRRRIPTSRIPIRENPAALAALQRAQERQTRNTRRWQAR